MRRRRVPLIFSCGLVVAIALAPASRAAGNVLLTNDRSGSYLRYDGASDETMDACSSDRRAQNEPTIAVDPRSPNIVTAGSNDYCAQVVNGDAWPGYYRSTDGGATWHDSLVPGYPTDESPAGTASPTHGVCGAAGDPTQSFDAEGRLYYGFICFNRAKPTNGSLFVALFDQDGAHYVRTVQVERGTPSVWGLFQDKINVVADATDGPNSGNVYVAWARYPGQSKNNGIQVTRSTDQGRTWSKPVKISPGVGEEQFADLAVGPDGVVYLTFRTISQQKSTENTIWIARSTDGGVSFSAPRAIANINQFDSRDYGGGDCGDSIFSCSTGFTYSRWSSLSAVAADETGVHVAWSGRTSTGQGKIYVRNSPDGVTWPTAASTLDNVSVGHQWTPDIASAEGIITVVFYDSREDGAYAPDIPPGNTADGKNSGDVVNTFIARSSNGGTAWTETQMSDAGSNFNWETHGSRRDPFWGDYIYVSAVPGGVNVVWTDSRDLVPGDDPRETGENDDEDGFDVYQPCVYEPNDINAPSYTSPLIQDPCLSQGGLDQNIYGARV
ncbi:MAG: sialidase family protein [Actinomycetota bacterium]